MEAKYKRILLKLSGEALAGDKKTGLDLPTINTICQSVKRCYDSGVEIGIVVGGGNFWRGRSSENMDRVTADHIGMLATTMNALAVGDALKNLGCEVRVMSAIAMNAICEPYIREKAIRNFEKGRIVIFGCGTGNPFFSTDTTAALRASEIKADVIFMAKNGVDGTGIEFHHIPITLAMLQDFLFEQAFALSNQNISFPNVKLQGAAFFNLRHYGFDSGNVFDEDNMWLWLKEGLIDFSDKNQSLQKLSCFYCFLS